MTMRLKLTIDSDGEEVDVFIFEQDEDGHLDVEASDSASLFAGIQRVEDMIAFIRADQGIE